MNEQSKQQECFEIMARVLIRCFLGGAIFLLIWFIAYVAAGDWIYRMHARWFSITREQFAAIHYSGMAATKIFIWVAFLIPYLCLRLVLRRKS